MQCTTYASPVINGLTRIRINCLVSRVNTAHIFQKDDFIFCYSFKFRLFFISLSFLRDMTSLNTTYQLDSYHIYNTAQAFYQLFHSPAKRITQGKQTIFSLFTCHYFLPFALLSSACNSLESSLSLPVSTSGRSRLLVRAQPAHSECPPMAASSGLVAARGLQ